MTDPLDIGLQTATARCWSHLCEHCQVSWVGESTCWMCGADTAQFTGIFVPRVQSAVAEAMLAASN